MKRAGLNLALLTTVFGFILYFAVGFYLKPVRAQTKTTQDESRANELRALLDSTDKRLEAIQKFAGVLVTVSTILGFAIGLSSVVNLREIRASAEKELSQLRADFPKIAQMEKGVERVFLNVRNESALMFDGWDEDRYLHLSEESRESIRMSEIAFSALEVFDPLNSPKLSRYAAETYMAFGRFYGSQYFTDHVDNEPAIERSKIYFRKAFKSDDEALRERAAADLGTVCCWHAAFLTPGPKKDLALKEARNKFDDACAIRSYNPAALIGRAWVKHRANETESAIHDLSDLVEALNEKKLSEEEKRRYLRTAYFNRACYRVVWGKSGPDKLDLFAQALDDLWDSKAAAIHENKFPLWLGNLDAESQSGKDLAPLLFVNAATELSLLRDRSAVKPATARQL